MSDKAGEGEVELKGKVRAVNLAPKGEIDGLLIEADGATIQVNIPPDRAAGIDGLVGQAVELTVGPEPKVEEHPGGAHRVHKLIRFGGDHAHRDAGKAEKPKPPHQGPGEPAVVSGTVARLNYAKHGEANGVVLDGGDFVHAKPGGMKKLGLEVGQAVTARGKSTPMPGGGRAIEAEVVNGIELGPGKAH